MGHNESIVSLWGAYLSHPISNRGKLLDTICDAPNSGDLFCLFLTVSMNNVHEQCLKHCTTKCTIGC